MLEHRQLKLVLYKSYKDLANTNDFAIEFFLLLLFRFYGFEGNTCFEDQGIFLLKTRELTFSDNLLMSSGP